MHLLVVASILCLLRMLLLALLMCPLRMLPLAPLVCLQRLLLLLALLMCRHLVPVATCWARLGAAAAAAAAGLAALSRRHCCTPPELRESDQLGPGVREIHVVAGTKSNSRRFVVMAACTSLGCCSGQVRG